MIETRAGAIPEQGRIQFQGLGVRVERDRRIKGPSGHRPESRAK